MFNGLTFVAVDAAWGLALPPRHLAGFPGAALMLAPDMDESPCRRLYPLPAWEALTASMIRHPVLATPEAARRRAFLTRAALVDIDRRGRITLPDPARDMLTSAPGQAILVGLGDYLEL